jgi:hypothetical protein
MKSNETGKYIFNILNENQEINDLIGDKNIHPLIVEYSAHNLHFITYKRNGSASTYTKDGLTIESLTLEITCVSTDYDESNELALLVRNVLDNHSTNEIRFMLETTNEDWEEGGRFIQTIIYTVNLK